MTAERAVDTFDPVDDPGFDGSTNAVREHYRRAGPVLDALESVAEYSTSGFIGNSMWYRYTDVDSLDRKAFDAGYRSFCRGYLLKVTARNSSTPSKGASRR